MLIVTEAVARAGLDRTESRGAHTRTDFPNSDKAQERIEIVVKQERGAMTLIRRKQPDLPADLEKIIKEGA